MNTKKYACLLLIACVAVNLYGNPADTTKREVYYEEGSPSELDGRINRALERAEKSIERATNQAAKIEDRFHDPDRAIRQVEKRTYAFSFADPKSKNNHVIRWNQGHYAGVYLQYCGLVASLGRMAPPADASWISLGANSVGVQLNPVDYAFQCSNRTAIVTGIGFELNNFKFDNNITLKRVDGVTVPDSLYIERGIHLNTSKLYTAYLNIPILFEVQLGSRHNYFINGGFVGGWRIGGRTVIRATDPELRGVFKNRGDLGLRNFHYGFMINGGIRNLALTASYYPHSIFRNGQGPNVRQVNIGLGLVF